jgi:hypothetical protein
LLVLACIGGLSRAAIAQAPTAPPPSKAAPSAPAVAPSAPVSLPAAVARTAAQPGWRVEALADGRLAMIGVNVAGDVTHVIGVACGASYRPEIAVDARGALAMPRAIVMEVGSQIAAIPIAPAGVSTDGVDALLSALAGTQEDGLKLSIEERSFPMGGARGALEPVWKQCEQLFGWRVTDPDPQQMFWSYVPDNTAEPALIFRSPSAGKLGMSLGCDPKRGALALNVADLVKGKAGQTVRLTLEANGEKFEVSGQTRAGPGGANLVAATIAEPEAVLAALAEASRLTVRTKGAQVAVPTRALGPLLPRFRHACALP